MLSFKYNQRYFSVLLCTGLLLSALTTIAFAQDAPGDLQGAADILKNAIEVSKSSEEGLTDLWEYTFTGNYSPAYDATIDFARKIMVIPFLWLFIPMTKAFVFSRYEEMYKHVLWLLIVMILAANSFALTSKISFGVRGFINDSTRIILEQQIGPITMQEALRDAILTESAKDAIRADFAECEAKEGPEQAECFQQGARKALKELEEAEGTGFWSRTSAGHKRLQSRLEKIINSNPEDVGMGVINFFFQSTGQALAQQLMKGFQNAMITMMDISFFLTAMLGPVAVAGTLAPLQPRIIMIWATAMLSFGMMKMAYNIIIGAIASVAQVANAGDFGSVGLLMAMAVVSPILAMAIAAWGGTRIVQSMASTSATIISMIPIPIPVK